MAKTPGKIENKLAKGQFAVLVEEHSSTPLRGKTSRHTTFKVIKVESATRDGLAKTYSTHAGGPAYKVGDHDQVRVISSYSQAILGALLGQFFEDKDALAAALKERVTAAERRSPVNEVVTAGISAPTDAMPTHQTVLRWVGAGRHCVTINFPVGTGSGVQAGSMVALIDVERFTGVVKIMPKPADGALTANWLRVEDNTVTDIIDTIIDHPSRDPELMRQFSEPVAQVNLRSEYAPRIAVGNLILRREAGQDGYKVARATLEDLSADPATRSVFVPELPRDAMEGLLGARFATPRSVIIATTTVIGMRPPAAQELVWDLTARIQEAREEAQSTQAVRAIRQAPGHPVPTPEQRARGAGMFSLSPGDHVLKMGDGKQTVVTVNAINETTGIVTSFIMDDQSYDAPPDIWFAKPDHPQEVLALLIDYTFKNDSMLTRVVHLAQALGGGQPAVMEAGVIPEVPDMDTPGRATSEPSAAFEVR